MGKKFEDFKLNKQLWTAIAELGYEEATPIQEKAIPSVLSGHDLIGIAQTGTGKTAAYVIPMLMKLKYAQGEDMRGLVLVPTRELAIQVEENIQAFGKYTDLRSVVLYGGIGQKQQKENLDKGLDIIVSTPGRFLDLYSLGYINTKRLQFLVLDEADRMMEMGFLGALFKIFEVIPRRRQNLLFSATLGEKVQQAIDTFLTFPNRIEITPQATTASTVSQFSYETPNFACKLALLKHLLDENEDLKKAIIFVKTRSHADNIYKFLLRKYGEDEVRVLHANKGQNTRMNSINAFKEENIRLLVATDVASRGIDVSMVSHVINFDVPIIAEDYVHRVGRTGRAYQTGVSITFCNQAEKSYLQKIEKLIRQTITRVALPGNIEILPTPFEEQQAMNREIDLQKRRENPDFKGAFHEKKRSNQRTKAPNRNTKKNR